MNSCYFHDDAYHVFMYGKIHSCNAIKGRKVIGLWMKKIKTILQESKCKCIPVALRPGVNERREEGYAILKEKYTQGNKKC